MGELVITFDGSGGTVDNYAGESFQTAYDRLYKLLNEDSSLYYAEDNFADFENSDAFNMFNQNHIMFVMAGLFAVDGMRTSDVDFGIVPVPKSDESQESYVSYNHGCSPIAITKTSRDPGMSAAVLELLMRVSGGEVVPVYYDQVLKGKVARDTESENMLDLIFSDLKFDFAFINDSALGGFWGEIHSMSNANIASLTASKSEAFDGKLTQLLEAIRELDD